MTAPERLEFRNGLAHPLGAAGDIRGIDLPTEADAHQGLVALLLPFIRDTDDGIRTLVVLEDSKELCEAAAISGRHAIDFVEDDAEGPVSFGTEKIAYIGRIEEGLDEF